MKKNLWLLALILSVSTVAAAASLPVCEITGFPPGQGTDVASGFWQDRCGCLEEIARALQADSSLRLELTGWADGIRYRTRAPHVPTNTSLAYNRCVAVAQQASALGIFEWQILPPEVKDTSAVGPQWRKVTLRVVPALTCDSARPQGPTDLAVPHGARERERNRFDQPDSSATCAPPPRPTCTGSCLAIDNVWVGTGLAWVGEKTVPKVWGQLGNSRLRFEAEAGYSCYHQQRTFSGEDLKVTYRYWNVGLAWHPLTYGRFDLLAGWQRFETYSTSYGRYASKEEGPTIGLRLLFGNHWALTGRWTPSEVSRRGEDRVHWDESRCYLGVELYTAIRGGK